MHGVDGLHREGGDRVGAAELPIWKLIFSLFLDVFFRYNLALSCELKIWKKNASILGHPVFIVYLTIWTYLNLSYPLHLGEIYIHRRILRPDIPPRRLSCSRGESPQTPGCRFRHSPGPGCFVSCSRCSSDPLGSRQTGEWVDICQALETRTEQS